MVHGPLGAVDQQGEKAMSESIGKNIKASVRGKYLVLKIKYGEKGKESSTGKSMVIASTAREGKLEDIFGKDFRRMSLNLNLYKAKRK